MIKQLLDKLFADDGKLVIGDPHAKLTDWLFKYSPWWLKVILVMILIPLFIIAIIMLPILILAEEK